MPKLRHALCLLNSWVGLVRGFSQTADVHSVRGYGAKADGTTHDIAAFQKALDAAGQAHGGTVMAGRGTYFFVGHLVAPNAVTLQGMWKSVPAHLGFRDRTGAKPADEGTIFLVAENEGKENGEPFIRLNDNSTLSGVVRLSVAGENQYALRVSLCHRDARQKSGRPRCGVAKSLRRH